MPTKIPQPLTVSVTHPQRDPRTLSRGYGKLVFAHMSRGDMVCILNALSAHASGPNGSPVARDILDAVTQGAVDGGIWPEVAEVFYQQVPQPPRASSPGPAAPISTQFGIAPGTYEFPNKGGDFTGIAAAHQFLADHGYSYGSMQRDSPIGVMFGNYEVSKWRDLNDAERDSLDGTITPFVVGWRDIVSNVSDVQPAIGGAVVTIR